MATWKDLDALLQSFVDGAPRSAGPLPGCGMQVTKNGETIYEGYFGYADLETKAPITAESLYRQASLSKLPLYTTAMILFEQGKFLMTEPLAKYLPEWKNVKKFAYAGNGYMHAVPTDGPVTVRDCLSMKCGLPYVNFPGRTDNRTLRSMQEAMQPLWEKGHFTNREHVEAIAKATLAFEPGTHWIYGFSSELTCALIEAVCGKGIDQVFQELIFDPLGMKNTRSRYQPGDKEKMVKLYKRGEGGKCVPATTALDNKHNPGPENEAGWARLFSTVNDYSRMMTALACGGKYNGVRLIGRKTIDLMRSNGLDEVMLKDFEDPYLRGYGYGYGVRTLIDKAKADSNGSLGMFGWTGGFGTWAEADPEEGVAIVYMHNLMPDEERFYHPRMRNVAYGCLE